MILTTILQPLAFGGLALAAYIQWRRRGSEPAKWLAATFVSLGLCVVLGSILPEDGHWLLVEMARRVVLVSLLLFPYLLFRFAASFGPLRPFFHRLAAVTCGIVLLITIAIPELPTPEEEQPAWLGPYAALVVVYWTALSLFAAARLWRAGRNQPVVARNRMRVLATGSAVLNFALILAAVNSPQSDDVVVVTQLLSLVSVAMFLLGFAPPASVIAAWRRREFAAFQVAEARLVRALTLQELTEGLLPAVAELVGADSAVLIGRNGEVIGSHGAGEAEVASMIEQVQALESVPADGAQISPNVYVLPVGAGWLAVAIDPYLPFFGSEEIGLLRNLGHFANLAIDRILLFERERDARMELERAISEGRESEQSFRLLVEGVIDHAMFHLDPDGMVVSWNSGAQRMKGYEASEIIGKPFTTFYPPEELESGRPWRLLEAARTTGRVEDEGWRVRKDGSRFWANVVLTALTDSEGRLTGFAKVTRDFTRRLAAEQALRESEQRFRGSFEAASIGMALVAPDGSFMQVNQALLDMLGWSREEILASNVVSLVHPDERSDAIDDLRKMVVGERGNHQVERRFQRADGSVIWAVQSAAPIYGTDGKFQYFTAQLHDITERKLGGEAQLRLAVDAAGMGTWDWNIATGHMVWSIGQARLLGLPDGTTANFETFLEAIHPDDRQSMADNLDLAMRSGAVFEHEFRVVHPGGEVRWLLGRGQALFDNNRSPRRMLGVTIDTTERRAAEAEQVRLLATEKQAADRAVRLQSITAALSEALTTDQVIDVLTEQAPAVVGPDGEWLLMMTEGDDLEVVRVDERAAHLLAPGTRIPIAERAPATDALRTRQPVYTESLQALADLYPDRFDAGVAWGRGSWALLPLVASGHAIGVWALGFTDEREFSADDRAFMLTIAGQCAQAFERARLYEQEHTIAETLQRSLLPEHLPVIPGAVAAVRYEAGGAGVDVGGDWYDVIALTDGRVGVVIGDVVGHGIRAATVMGQIRSSLRAYALEGHGPAAVLASCNRVVSALGGEHMATAIYATLDPATGELVHASAGHPPALLAGPDGVTFLEGGRGLPLGVSMRATFTEATVHIAPGTALICYTDGLVEVRGKPINEGLTRLRETVTEALEQDATDVEALCDHILAELRQPDHADDTALVAVRLTAEHAADIEVDIPASFDELAPLRRRLGAWLAAGGVDEEARMGVVLSVCEAATNAIEHGYGPVEATVHIAGRLYDGEVWVSVKDSGSWREPRGSTGVED